MKLHNTVIYLAAAVFGLYGLAYALQPYDMALLTTGLKPDTSSGLIDLRATYGGLMLTIAALIIYAQRKVGVAFSLTIIWVSLSLMAATRSYGFLVDGAANNLMYAYLAAEIIGSLLAIWLQRSAPN